MQLAHLRRNAERENGGVPAVDTVFSIPAYWTDAQRRAFLDACEIAEIKVNRLLNDNTAAAVQYGFPIPAAEFKDGKKRTVVFVDCGHADLQASIVEFDAEGLRVKATAFDAALGGRDLDKILYDHFVEEFKGKYNIDINSNQKARLRLAKSVQKMKHVLSANSEASFHTECIMNDVDVSGKISRDEFLELAEPLFARVRECLERLLVESEYTMEQIDFVEIVGGTSRMPRFKEVVGEVLQMDISNTLNNEEALASGASWAAAMSSNLKQVKPYHIHDCTLYPIKLSWKSSEQTEDGMNVFKSSNVFKKFNNFPSTKVLNLYQYDEFQIQAEYSQPEELPLGTDVRVADFIVNGLPADTSGKIKARVRINLWGVASLESCQLIDEVIDEEASSDSKEGDAMETESNSEEPKTKKVKTNLNIRTLSTSMTRNGLDMAQEVEGQLQASDTLVRATAHARNNLESFLYDSRYHVEGELMPYCTEEFRESFSSTLLAAEDWLYDEFDASKSVYENKLQELENILKPVQSRFDEAQNRDAAATRLTETANEFITEGSSGAEKYAHIPSEDMEKVVKTCTDALDWLNNAMEQQSQMDRTVDPIITVAEINAKRDNLFYVCRPILTRKKVEIPKPTNMDTEPANNNNADAGSSNDNNTEGDNKQGEQQGDDVPEESDNIQDVPLEGFEDEVD
eukprot:TRINITY_DN4112_c0_g1_i4.p1 TRINITY_DN4112_c0_g1~~TRINITY_DN4112_c0_g1_i4.p1  ORF type:complete len:685 (+),score=287.03 TRINITY_DN4112_c0_g1_i4:767-2821(+)